MLLVGLTGGIGSGKTSVSSRLGRVGAVIIDADAIVHELQSPGQQVLAEMVELLGDGIGAELSRAVHTLADALPIELDFEPVDLSLETRRARQDAITTEIMEIVGGAEALRQAKSGGGPDYLIDTVINRDVLPDQIDPSRIGARP